MHHWARVMNSGASNRANRTQPNSERLRTIPNSISYLKTPTFKIFTGLPSFQILLTWCVNYSINTFLMFVYYQLVDFSASLLFNAWICSYFPLLIVFRHGERFSKLCLPSSIGCTRYPVLSSNLTMFCLEDTFYGWMLLFSLDSLQPDNCCFFS